MTPFEEQIIGEIIDHTHLKEAQKQKYIAAFLLMNAEKKQDFAILWEKFKSRSARIGQGDFLLNQGDIARLRPLFEGIKNRLLFKITNNLA